MVDLDETSGSLAAEHGVAFESAEFLALSMEICTASLDPPNIYKYTEDSISPDG